MKYVIVDGTNAIVAVEGRFDLVKSMEVENELKTAVNTQGCSKIVIDFQKTMFIDSSANRLFKKQRDLVGGENIEFRNIVHPAVMKALKTAKLDRIFTIN